MTIPITMTSSPNVVGCASRVSENGVQQQQPQPQFSYVLLQLQRPNCTIPWGLSLTLFEERYLVLGDVNEVHLNHDHKMVQTCWSTQACPINPSLFWMTTLPISQGQGCRSSSSSSSSSLLSPSQIASFVQHLVQYPYCSPTVRSILPGDCILAVNGKTIAGNFTTLSQATGFLSSQTHLFLIILRLQGRAAASSSLGHGQQAPSPTSTLRFPILQQQQQQQQHSDSESSIFQTAKEAWHTLRLLNQSIIYPSTPPPPPPPTPSSLSLPSSSSTTCDSWSAADALLCLRGNNLAVAASPAAATVVVKLQPQQQQKRNGGSASMAFSTPMHPSMMATPHPFAFWSPPPCPPSLLLGGIYSYSTSVVPSSSSSSPQRTHHHWPSGRRDFQRPILHYNPLFREQVNKQQNVNSFGGPPRGAARGGGCLLPYEDDWDEEPDEGQRARLFLKPIDNSSPETFGRWLQQRKGKWRQERFTVHTRPTLTVSSSADLLSCSKMEEGFVLYRNPLFCENPKNGNKIQTEQDSKSTSAAMSAFFGPTSGLPYDDDLEFEPDDGQRAKLFLHPIDTSSPDSFGRWLNQRKRKWRQTYKVYPLETNLFVEDDQSSSSSSSSSSTSLLPIEEELARNELNVAVDFWSLQGHASFQHWLSSSKLRWKSSYSWNKRKRRRIQEDCDQVVRLMSPLHHHHHHHHRTGDDDDKSNNNNNNNNDNFAQWLRVRKNQWRVLRRKRQRERIMEQSMHQRDQHEHDHLTAQQSARSDNLVKKSTASWATNSPTSARDLCQQLHQPSFQSDELLAIDAFLEDQERERQRLAKETQKTLDISFLFDASLDCPDDVVVHCLQYLDPPEHCKLLCLNRETRQALSKREEVWRQLCPTTWQLPRRPRKPWHVLYLAKLRTESERSRKRCDEVLARAANILLKGDQLQAIEKLCAKAEQAVAMPFDVNYSSGVVCERNTLLNLAVINQRHKVVRWLVETMKADIETYDRGGFTPLLNAAWAGDKFLVRYFLAKSANRGAIGTCHYTKPLAAPDFAGLNAAGWARKQGHENIAKLIELGI